MITVIVAIITGGLVFICEEYFHGVYKPAKLKQPKPMLQEWQDFVYANINQSLHDTHFLQCFSLINLFDRKFRNHMPPDTFKKIIENMWNRLDTRSKSVKIQEMSNTTIGQLLNEIK